MNTNRNKKNLNCSEFFVEIVPFPLRDWLVDGWSRKREKRTHHTNDSYVMHHEKISTKRSLSGTQNYSYFSSVFDTFSHRFTFKRYTKKISELVEMKKSSMKIKTYAYARNLRNVHFILGEGVSSQPIHKCCM